MKRSADDDNHESSPPSIVELGRQEQIDNFRAAVMYYAESVNGDILHELGSDPRYLVVIITKFEESISDCDRGLDKSWFLGLVKVGKRGKVKMLTDKKTRSVSEGWGRVHNWVRYNV